jgi:antitoxin CptB
MSDRDKIDAQRVYWHSRRGMLELDLVLMPFAEQVYPTLDEATRARYRDLLACEDTDIFAWLVHDARTV